MEISTFKLPRILPSSNSTINSDRPLNVKHSTSSYEQWRANIHRQLEEDLQRQVQELLEETDRQERAAKLKGQYHDTGQSSLIKHQETVDALSEIDRRNDNVLHPVKSKPISESQNDFSLCRQSMNEISNKPFYLNSYHSYRPLREFLRQTDDQNYMNPSMYLNKHTTNPSPVVSINSNSSILLGNSIIKSNKATLLNISDQQFLNGDDSNNYTNKYGINIDDNGPFWPETYRILHPTPKLLSRELTPKEFYLSPTMSSKKRI
ncbi:unnamed protein product [Rotaria socialis]|uniref:Uncharacterized protein n=1 Tax=Rotaria socialis TaxID=392032 RepID=A0A820LW88_9BILA|nr:unnamed protein product [Rotaria socialis]CAF4362988.1 unnamed protein product [Rotaria socialis]